MVEILARGIPRCSRIAVRIKSIVKTRARIRSGMANRHRRFGTLPPQ